MATQPAEPVRRGLAPATGWALTRTTLRVATLVGLGTALLAIVLFQRAYVTPDSVWGLIWGRQLAGGELPAYDTGPTPHPLTVLAATVTAQLGERGNYLATYLIFGPLALGLLAGSTYAVARRLASPGAGAVAVFLLLTSRSLLGWAASARYDVLFAGIVMLALALELTRPRSGKVQIGLLAVAGLIRPEAWVIAAVYWLWRVRSASRGDRIALTLIAAAAPLLWVATDAIVTGDPLWSFHMTAEASDALYGRYTRLENLGQAGKDLLAVAGPFALLAAPFALSSRVRRTPGGTALVWTLLALTLGVFLLLIAKGMASSDRYLLLPTCMLVVLASVAAASWSRLAAPLVIAGLAVLMIATFVRADGFVRARDEIRPYAAWTDDLRELVARPDVERMLAACPAASFPGPIAYEWVYWSGRPLDRWHFDEGGRRVADIYAAPATPRVAMAVLTRDRFDDDAGFEVPAGMVPGPANAAWRLHLAPAAPCTAAARTGSAAVD